MHVRVDAFDDFEEGAEDPTVADVFDQLPPDPGLVHVDLPVADLPMDAIDEIEALDEDDFEALEQDTQEAPRPTPPPPERRPRNSLLLEPGPLPPPPPRKRDNLHLRMISAFVGSMLATLLLTLLPWMVFGSPALQQMRDNAAIARQPKIVEVPKPVVVEKMVPVPVAAEPVPEVEPEPVAAAPVVKPKPVVKPRQPRPRARPTPRPKPVAAAPKPAPAPQPAPVEPVVEAPPPPPPPPKVPEAAKALNGKIRGKAGGDSLYADVILKSKGRAILHVKRGDDPWTTARGTYTLSGDRATLAVVEPGDDGASYSLTLDGAGATGRITYPNGKSKPVKVSR